MRLFKLVFGLLMLLAVVMAIAAYELYSDGSTGGAIVAAIFGLPFLLVGWQWVTGGGKRYSWKNDPTTDKQKEFANDLGIKYPKNITKGELSALISEVTGK